MLALALLLSTFVMLAGCTDTHDSLAEGHASYDAYCMSCHGPEGKGNGFVVTALSTVPSDLTQLAARNHGTFPTEQVYRMIDGRKLVPAHGTREMPIWGNIWSDRNGTPVQYEVVDQRINELVEYIRTLQATS